MRLLAIDDNRDNLVSLSALLRTCLPGCEVWTAESGPDGLDKARLTAPDTILLDVQMPGMDGFEVCRTLKSDDRTSSIPVIFLTAHASGSGNRIRGLEVGGDAFLTKPVDVDELTAQVRAMLRLKRAEDALRHEKAQLERRVAERTAALEEAQRLSRVGSWEYDVAADQVRWSAQMFRLFGREEALGEPPGWQAHRASFHPDDWERLDAAVQAATRDGTPFDLEFRLVGGGTETWARTLGAAERDPSGRVVRLKGTVQDISDRKRADEQRASLEAQLRHSQKMEAIGRLAGGVAHDFNSLITVIINYASFAAEGLSPEDPLRADLAEIRKAGERAASLTKQLLVFSRKQVLVAEPVDLNATIAGMRDMLRRLLGEHIELDTLLAPALGEVLSDAGLVSQVVMNLAVNSRDAMPQGGRLTLETQRDHGSPGPGWIELRVTDTGAGMDEETRARCFEPFFTTKPVGKGTGLGLAVVYGIVEQCGGTIAVRSAAGQGTTFTLRLPCIDDQTAASHVRRPGAAVKPAAGEAILVVEDDEGVRRLALRILKQAGYQVTMAASAEEALALSAAGPLDLLVTDVVMPRVSGRLLAEKLREQRPGLRVLYMSGYPDDDLQSHGLIPGGTALLNKPFTPRQLVQKVQEALVGRLQ